MRVLSELFQVPMSVPVADEEGNCSIGDLAEVHTAAFGQGTEASDKLGREIPKPFDLGMTTGRRPAERTSGAGPPIVEERIVYCVAPESDRYP